MADRSPDRPADPAHDDPADDDAVHDDVTEEPQGPTPLTERWWWTGAALVLVGAVVVGWQWDVIAKGDAIAATWAVVALGAAAVVVGGLWIWRDRPKRSDDS